MYEFVGLETTTMNTPDIKNTAKTSEISVKTTHSIDNYRVLTLCIADKRGHCVQHGIKMTKSLLFFLYFGLNRQTDQLTHLCIKTPSQSLAIWLQKLFTLGPEISAERPWI